MRLKKNSTLRDVAEKAGVSVGTVSRYLNGCQTIKEYSVDKIETAISELKYYPNNIAKRLGSGKTNTILLVMLLEYPIGTTTWIYEGVLLQGVHEGLSNSDYTLQIELIPPKIDSLKDVIRANIDTKSVDGVIISSVWAFDDYIGDVVENCSIPHILIGGDILNDRNNVVQVDNYQITVEIIERLCALNHKDIAMITGNLTHQHMIDRLSGYNYAVESNMISFRDEYLKHGMFEIESGVKCVRELLVDCRDNMPSAILCGDDYIAMGVIGELKRQGLRVPQDISIVGFGDYNITAAIDPALTSVRLPIQEMGKVAVEKILYMLNNNLHNVSSQVLNCKISERDSVLMK